MERDEKRVLARFTAHEESGCPGGDDCALNLLERVVLRRIALESGDYRIFW